MRDTLTAGIGFTGQPERRAAEGSPANLYFPPGLSGFLRMDSSIWLELLDTKLPYVLLLVCLTGGVALFFGWRAKRAVSVLASPVSDFGWFSAYSPHNILWPSSGDLIGIRVASKVGLPVIAYHLMFFNFLGYYILAAPVAYYLVLILLLWTMAGLLIFGDALVSEFIYGVLLTTSIIITTIDWIFGKHCMNVHLFDPITVDSNLIIEISLILFSLCGLRASALLLEHYRKSNPHENFSTREIWGYNGIFIITCAIYFQMNSFVDLKTCYLFQL